MADEHGKPAKHQTLELGQKPEAPVQSGLQCLLARRGGALARPQQGQPFLEKGRGLLKAVACNPSGGQLDRERHAVELPAHLGHDHGIRVVEIEASAARRGAFHEQLGRGEALRNRYRELGIVRRACQRRQLV
ncbi:MAG: hypothetical protein E5W56_16750, partial [Mesorhizobium sp.]